MYKQAIQKETKMKYTVILLKDDKQVGKYKLEEDMFNDYKKRLEPYISLQTLSKPVMCIGNR